MSGARRSFHSSMFDLLAPLYDLAVWLLAAPLGGEGRLRGAIIEAVSPVKGAQILELFAGTATLSLLAAGKGALAPVALDISAGMLNVAHEKSAKSGCPLLPVRADATALPFRNDSFDRVVASMGLHELSPDALTPVLQESFRVLKRGGRLVIFDYCKAEGFYGFLQKAFFIFAETDDARSFVSRDIQELLRNAGYRDFRRFFAAKRALQLITVEKK